MTARKLQYQPPLIRTPDQLTEFYKCQTNFLYFISKYIKIVTLEFGTVDFKLFPFQIAAIRAVHENDSTISLKPRQMGMSTLLCAYLLWLAMFKREQNILIISIKFNVAKSFLRKMKSMYRKLPEYLKMEITNGYNGTESKGTTESIQFANGSEINISASTPDAGRSEALNFLLMDEVAFQKNASAIWGSAQQTLATGGKVCMISTAYGVGNLFHKVWTKAVEGKNGFFPIKLDWRMHPHRNQAWYDKQSRAMGAKRTAQEIDCDFLKSGYNVFDLNQVREIEELFQEHQPLQTYLNGDLLVHLLPNPNSTYVIGADVSTGRSRDYSAFSIVDLEGREHVSYKGKITPAALGKLLMHWGYIYNTATIAVEINGVGEGAVAILVEHEYPNIYTEIKKVKKKGEVEPQEMTVYGWQTTGKTRGVMITGLDEDLIAESIVIYSPFFTSEAYTFVYDEHNRPVALGKTLKSSGDIYEDGEDGDVSYTDDYIMAKCISNEVRKRVKVRNSAMPFIGE